MIQPTYEEFARAARAYPVVPVCREILADLETPVSAFRKLAAHGPAALLESMEGGETWGRYSMIGLDPSLVFESRDQVVRVTIPAGGGKADGASPPATALPFDLPPGNAPVPGGWEWEEDRPLQTLDRILREHRTASLPGLPRLAGGAVGFASYDWVRRIERIPAAARDDLGFPDTRFIFFETTVLFDHQFHSVLVVVNSRPGPDAREAYERACSRIEEITRTLSRPEPAAAATPTNGTVTFTSSVSKERFLKAVERAKEYIRAGDVVQVVLSQRLEAEIASDPFDVYRALRVINPSPYLFFLRTDDLTLVGSSPEVLVRREGTRVETRPIAGTRPRGGDEIADRLLEEDLKASEKERAEHIMLVDLGRNDLGRVCRFGTVETTEFMAVERYSHVMHLVSHVVGTLRDGIENADIMEACFPAGTVSGAPKIRAMEIIDELEPVRRGIYAGAMGYIDFHGNMDTCITIRTMVFRHGRVFLGAGAGIVADSDAEGEYAETLRKAGALMRACELAARGLASFSRQDAQRYHPGEIGGPPEGGAS